MAARYSPATYDNDILEDLQKELMLLNERADKINPPGSVYSNISDEQRPEFDDILREIRRVQAMVDRQMRKVVDKHPLGPETKHLRLP